MATTDSQTQQCPFCKEEIHADAVRCKHCRSQIARSMPAHQGVCPFCKEDIKTDAVRCRHCGANVGLGGDMTLPHGRRPTRHIPRLRTTPDVRQLPRGGSEPTLAADPSDVCEGCAPYDVDDVGIWVFLECSEHYCIYELEKRIGPFL